MTRRSAAAVEAALTLAGQDRAVTLVAGCSSLADRALVVLVGVRRLAAVLVAAADPRHPRSRNLPIVRFVVAATIILLMTIPTAFLIIYMEMKIIALMNLRIGPDRVGPFGSLLSVVHGLKVLVKEDFTPTGADSLVFTLGPGRRLPRERHDAARHPVRARACSART